MTAPVPTAVCALVRDAAGRVLAVSRRHDHADLGLPGGKVDPGEAPTAAALRELHEETGLVGRDPVPVFTMAAGGHVTTTFVVVVDDDEIHTAETGRVAWLEPDELDVLTRGSFGTYNLALLTELGVLLGGR